MELENKKQILERILNDLYHLEDRTEYKIKKISKSIDLLQKIKIK